MNINQYLEVGTGDPNSVVTAPVGYLFLRTDGGAGTILYVKETGTGNTGWVAYTSGSGSSIAHLSADASATLTCTNSYADITGATITLTGTGTYLIIADCSIQTDTAAGGGSVQLMVNGVAQTGVADAAIQTATAGDNVRCSASKTWFYTNSGSNVAKLQGKKANAGGNASIGITNTGIRAIFLG